MPTDDVRAAATIRTTLSGSVIAAALVVLGAQAAIATFAIEKEQNLGWFYVCFIVASALLLGSMIAGAKGIAAIYKEGYGGKWELGTGKTFFVAQALLAVGGAVAVLLSVYAGTLKPDTPAAGVQKLEALERQVALLAKQLEAGFEAVTKQLGAPAAYDEGARYRAIVETVQGALKGEGLYQDGAVDGIVGPRTRRALEEFQRRESLPVTRRIDNATVKRLRL